MAVCKATKEISENPLLLICKVLPGAEGGFCDRGNLEI